ncbi:MULTISPECIES: CYTH domain-containing protein [unclassified Aureimonas]|uniref:CYTH domain-containing protein n=1 Tax=unclassified Aureimonas TaxID=2615206 RepID=UPI0007015DFA|nr:MULTISPECIES: CYTH domain-containing protein [unclassified Aureimonas]KQT66154.1 hypothetical protein ASG62_20350 [Aureimonas sp. Leaf427]KQT73399.1 hypothetical protein ASG54_17735 [Aureimonas sp. Leaf460]
MGIEIERRFLVETDDWRAAFAAGRGRSRVIRQIYLASDETRTIRIRIADGSAATLTIKLGAGLSRGEFEYEIPLADAEELAKGALGTPIDKTRHDIPLGKHVVELDVYAGSLSPLVVAEIELAAEDEAVTLPSWLGREITGDPAYSNARLALAGRP